MNPIITPRRNKGARKGDSSAKKKHSSYIEDKYIKYSISNDFKNPIYDKVYENSISNKEKFWQE